MKLTLYKDCRLVKIETEAFRLTLGELQNSEIKAVLKPLGIEVQFIEDPDKTRYDQAEISNIAKALEDAGMNPNSMPDDLVGQRFVGEVKIPPQYGELNNHDAG